MRGSTLLTCWPLQALTDWMSTFTGRFEQMHRQSHVQGAWDIILTTWCVGTMLCDSCTHVATRQCASWVYKLEGPVLLLAIRDPDTLSATDCVVMNAPYVTGDWSRHRGSETVSQDGITCDHEGFEPNRQLPPSTTLHTQT